MEERPEQGMVHGKGNRMNTTTRAYRLDDLLKIIKRNKFTTMVDLATLTGVTSRTVQRDVARIKKEHPQVKTVRGNGGGVMWEGETNELV